MSTTTPDVNSEPGAAAHPAPGLLRQGLDVTTVARKDFPAPLWREIEAIALQSRREATRWELVCSLHHHCDERLARGESIEEITTWLRDRDVRQLLHSGSAIRATLVETNLPLPLVRQVNAVRKRLPWKLWGRLKSAEREQGVVDLCLRQSAALEQGRSAEQLARTPLRALVREVGREQRRKRWWPVRIFRAVRAVCVCTLLGVLAVWGLLALRLAMTPRSSNTDLIDRFDRLNDEIPEADRAWPLIRDVSISTGQRVDPGYYKIQAALTAGTSHADWGAARDYLQQHRSEIDRLVEASRKPGMGHKYRDDGNNIWYQMHGSPNWRQSFGSLGSMWQIPLHQTTSYQGAIELLIGAFIEAWERRDFERATQLLVAQFRIAELVLKAPDFEMVQANMRFQIPSLFERALTLVEGEAAALTPEQLQVLAAAVQSLDQTVADTANPSTGLTFNDLLNSLYSDGSRGRITSEGLQVLRQTAMVDPQMLPLALWLGDPRPPRTPPYVAPQDLTWLTGPVIAPFVDNRATTEARLNELFPPGTSMTAIEQSADLSAVRDAELARITATDLSTIRHSPLLLLLGQATRNIGWGLRAKDMNTLMISAARLRIALEQFRRQTGAYPAQSSELVPAYLTELPRDIYGTAPLGFRLVNGRPLIYSVGLDGKDQTATLVFDADAEVAAHGADQQLCPSPAKVKK